MSENWIKIKKLNHVYGRIYASSPSIILDINRFFTIAVPKFWFSPKYKAGLWNGRIEFVKKNGKFALGLFHEIYKFIKGCDYKIYISKDFKNDIEINDFNEILDMWLKDGWIPRNHQSIGALLALQKRTGILEHATSSGKSLTMAMIIMYSLLKKLNNKILVLVPNLSLISQLTNDFIEYGVPPDWIGNFTGMQKDTEQPIIISTWQSMYKQPDLIKIFDGIIVDETHGLKAEAVNSVAQNATNATLRIGCTGSLPSEKTEIYTMMGMLGSVLHRKTQRELIDDGQASDILIKIFYLSYIQEIKDKLKGLPYEVEKEFIETYKPRNHIISKICKKHIDKDHNMIILVNKLDHGKDIYNYLQEKNIPKEIFFVSGEMDPKERERIRSYTNENKGIIIVATSGVFSTGISIKRIHAIIFADGGKSEIRTIQSIGRGLRLHNEKRKFILYDIGDGLKYSEKHLEERIKIYTKAEFDISTHEINFEGILNGSP